MASQDARDRLQPTLLDRLTDLEPLSGVEAEDTRVMTKAQIREAVLTDTRKQVDNATFELGIQGLRGVITAREPDILAQVP